MYSLRGAVLWVVVAADVVMQCDAAVSCLDENGKPVDWFIVVKLPTISASSKPQVRAGYAYMYMDNHQTDLALSNVWLNANNHAIAYTLQQIYNNHGSHNNLFVETWQNGGNKMQPFCGGTYNVNNIVSLKFVGVDGYKRTKDHSKWAVTAPKGSKWICIGDINRMLSQKLRSGGTVCFNTDSAHKNFLNTITDFEKCPP